MKVIFFAITLCLFSILFSCGNAASDEEKTLAYSTTDSTSVSGLTGDSVKLVKTASINIKVKTVEQSVRDIAVLAQKSGGMLTLQNLESVEQDRKELRLSPDSVLVITAVAPRAEIVARVPSQNLETFLFSIADLGYFTSNSHFQVDDKSLVYLENVLKEKNRTETLTQVRQKIGSKASTSQTIALKDEAIEQQISNRAIDADVNYSTVSLTLFQNSIILRETVANTYLDTYELSFWKRLGYAFENGWDYFLNFIIALTNFWMFVCLGILGFVFYKYWQQKRKLT